MFDIENMQKTHGLRLRARQKTLFAFYGIGLSIYFHVIFAGVGSQDDVVPDMLHKVMHMVATLVRTKREQAERVLPTIRPAMTEVCHSTRLSSNSLILSSFLIICLMLSIVL